MFKYFELCYHCCRIFLTRFNDMIHHYSHNFIIISRSCRHHRGGDFHHPLHAGVPGASHVPSQGLLPHQRGQRGGVCRLRWCSHHRERPRLHRDHRREQEGVVHLATPPGRGFVLWHGYPEEHIKVILSFSSSRCETDTRQVHSDHGLCTDWHVCSVIILYVNEHSTRTSVRSNSSMHTYSIRYSITTDAFLSYAPKTPIAQNGMCTELCIIMFLIMTFDCI